MGNCIKVLLRNLYKITVVHFNFNLIINYQCLLNVDAVVKDAQKLNARC